MDNSEGWNVVDKTYNVNGNVVIFREKKIKNELTCSPDGGLIVWNIYAIFTVFLMKNNQLIRDGW